VRRRDSEEQRQRKAGEGWPFGFAATESHREAVGLDCIISQD
jgi:hypothetical protein